LRPGFVLRRRDEVAARLAGPTGFCCRGRSCSSCGGGGRPARRDRSAANTRFRVGDASDMSAEGPVDAAVGRLVLEFSRARSAMLRSVAAQVRPGGVIAFQEVDWSGCWPLPDLPTPAAASAGASRPSSDPERIPTSASSCTRRSSRPGSPHPRCQSRRQPRRGRRIPCTRPRLNSCAPCSPALEALGVATAREVDVETLASRISGEAVAADATVIW
jgi:hypothetical protein